MGSNDNQAIQLKPIVKIQVDTANSLYLFYGDSDGKVYYDYFSLLDVTDDQQFLSVKRYYHVNHNVLVQTDKAGWNDLINKLQNYKTYKEDANNRF